MQVPGVNQVKVNSSENVWHDMINNPDINPADRDLIQRYFKGEVSKQKLLDRYFSLEEEQIKNYDGKVSLTNSRLARRICAFGCVLEHLAYQGKIKTWEMAYASKNVFKKYLKPEDKELIEKYNHSASRHLPEWRRARQAIIDRILSYQDQLDGAIWGTLSKIETYQRSMALGNMISASIREDEIAVATYLKLFGLSAEPPQGKDDYKYWICLKDYIKQNVLPIEEAINSSEMIDDQEVKYKIMKNVMLSYAQYLQYLQAKELDSQLIDQAGTTAAIFIGFARETGVSQEELEAIKSEVEHVISKPEIKQVDLQEIKRPLVATPETLPRSVIHFLEKVKIKGRSGYQFVKENVNYIILNPRIKSSGNESITGGESPLGIASSFIPIIEIDIYDEDKKAYRTALELINTIIHEAFHVYWMKKHFNDPKMLSSAINEGVANLAGLTASRELLSSLRPDPQWEHLLGNRPKEVINNFEMEIKNDLSTVGGAIQELGLDPEKVLKDIDLPKFLRASLKGNDENDKETYPTLTPYAIAQSYLTFLNVPGEERTRLSPIFEEVIKGKDLFSLDEKERRSVHKLLANIGPRYRKMKYDEVIKELRGLYGYYAWKEYKPQEESYIKSVRAKCKDVSIKVIENWQNQSRKEVKESIQEVKSGKRDDLILDVLAQLRKELKKI